MTDDLKKLHAATDAPPPKKSKGVKLARANRAKCNDLTEEQRETLVEKAMKKIYGGQASTVCA